MSENGDIETFGERAKVVEKNETEMTSGSISGTCNICGKSFTDVQFTDKKYNCPSCKAELKVK